ncbi:toprim domain-containing protein [Brevundimonas staleyi]|uniref:Toprim domain-containing protein n=1 Tax=Brevundimonas staleyi TaxID=74326 RepID=A0ABW0FV15_9CAUL
MTLRRLVAALGGDLYQGGTRANVPAPGHSAADRSISLALAGDRVLIHGFGSVDWRAARDDLARRGLIDAEGRLTGIGSVEGSAPRPDARVRLAVATRLWDEGHPLGEATPAALHLHRRGVTCGARAQSLRHNAGVPLAVYRGGTSTRPALVARISDGEDRLTGVEVTYLDPAGRLATGLAVPRKTVGLVPGGAAVRLAVPGASMLVGEGVMTTLSAMERFGLRGWALMSAQNLARWTPPETVRSVLIAADRGAAGETAAERLRARLTAAGLAVEAIWPDPPHGDWNDAAQAGEGKEG